MSLTRNIGDGRKTVTTAGTRVQLTATQTECQWVVVQALSANTTAVAVGGVTVVAASGTERGTVLLPLDAVKIMVDDVSKLYVDSRTSGEGVAYTFGA